MTTYSHSKLSTFEQCRYKYKLHYIDKVKVEVSTTVEAFMGDIVHQTLEKLYKDLKFQKINSLKKLLALFNEKWNKQWTNDVLIVKKEYGQDNYKKMGEKYITDYYNHYAPFDQITILGIETQDRIELPDGNHYHIRIDKFGCKKDVYYVCDYKTNVNIKDQEEADNDRQLAMYSIWVKQRFKDAKKVVLLWHMLAFDKEVTSERTQEQLEKLQKETITRIKEIETCKEYPTTVTTLCNYCEYKSICPAWKHDIELEKKTAKEFKQDEGVKLVDSFAELSIKQKETEDKLEEIRNNLILFAQQQGITIVYGSNKKASVKEFVKVVYPEDKEKLIKLLKEKGMYEELSMLNYMKLNSQITKDNIDKEVIKLIKKEKDYRVSLSKRKEEE